MSASALSHALESYIQAALNFLEADHECTTHHNLASCELLKEITAQALEATSTLEATIREYTDTVTGKPHG